MRRFNPEKELKRVQYGDRNKLIGIIMFLLVIIAVGSTYALYQVRHTKSLVYTTVSDFKKRDIYLSVLVDGKTQGDFPKNDEGKIYSGIECDKPYSEAYFDNTEWKLHFTSDGPNKCTVKFETGNLPNAPELFQGMIPIVFSDTGLMYVADTSKDWYNYQDHRWANAVLVDASNTTIKNKYFKEDNTLRDDIAGNQVLMEEVLQMYVWIPRYKYQLFNANNGTVPEQMINVIFEAGAATTGTVTCEIDNKGVEKCIGAENGEWYTHPAFKFGNTDLNGIWVGKFETSGTTTDVKILPDIVPTPNTSVYSEFTTLRNIEEEYGNKYNLNKDVIDTHMMKNMDWGAMVYLTHSKYGKCDGEGVCEEVVQNTQAYKTGYDNTGSLWYTVNGQKASTTGNMYGIYDTHGGAWDFVMGVTTDATGSDIIYINSGFTVNTKPDEKYYDLYEYDEVTTSHKRGHLGDATREILKGVSAGWYNNGAIFPYSDYPWFSRGNQSLDVITPGIFSFIRTTGNAGETRTPRAVLTAQDGND